MSTLRCLLGFAFLGPTLFGHSSVLEYDDFQHYVERFNSMEDEFVSHLVSNAESWDWMKDNVPAFDCPDEVLEEIYWYRWWTFRKCLIEADGFVTMTEFIKRKPVSSGVGHHIMESRWIRDQDIGDQILKYWLRGSEMPNDKRRYSGWTVWAAYERYLVTGDAAILHDLFSDFERYYEGWEADKMEPDGSFWQYDVRDAMEESISGSRETLQLRPPLNSYMYGNALAMAKIAGMAQRADVAANYLAKAERLKEIVLEDLWDESARFFKTRIGGSYDQLGPHSDAREAIGFIPWYFSLPDPNNGYEAAWKELVDPQGFWAPYGITTAERRHPLFRVGPTGTCEWNGPVWPYATSQTLTALGNVLNDYEQSYVGKDHYLEAMQTYAKSMYRDGRPYIGEYLDELTGEYLRDPADIERGRYYNHSTFCDLLINNLVGIRPQEGDRLVVNPLIPEDEWSYFCLDAVPYKGRFLTVLWDESGERYGRGSGFAVWVDGVEVARSPRLQRVEIELPARTVQRYEANFESLQKHPTPVWFKDAKLGIFVHWGLYSVPAWAPVESEGENMQGVQWFHHNPYAEWYLNSLRLGDTPTRRHHEEVYGSDYDYYEFGKAFNEAVRDWNPEEMAALFASTHARYVVLTSKHHDGFPLWTSEVENPHLPEAARQPSRDIVGELTDAVRSRGIRMGLYYSGGIDWSFHPVVIDGTQPGTEVTPPPDSGYADYADAHLRELIARYQPSVIWNDIRYPGPSDIHGVLAEYYNAIPDGAVNNRWGSSVKVPHDFLTQEYKKFDTIQETYWEANRGIGASFGYNRAEGVDDYLTGKEIIALLIDVVSKNGNLLLNVGPKPDGTIPEIQVERLRELGAWLKVNGEAIFDTVPWKVSELPIGEGSKVHFTYRENEDAVYLLFDGGAVEGELLLPGCTASSELEITKLGRATKPGEIEWRSDSEGLRVVLTQREESGAYLALRLAPGRSLTLGNRL